MSGPVRVLGARLSDVLEVEVLVFGMTRWGWTATIPGFGLLADQFPDPWLEHGAAPDSADERTSGYLVRS